MSQRTPAASSEDSIPWEEARSLFKRILASRLASSGPDDLEDLIQEALVRLLRAIRREPANNLEALMVEIARRTAIDYMRRRKRWSLILERSSTLETIVDPRPFPSEAVGDPATRLEFVVLEYFRSTRSSCLEIANAYFEARSWPAVAARTGIRPATVRKRWSRCLEQLRKAARSNASMLLDWER